MSCSNWERGEIKLPSTAAVAFRHDMVNFYNNRMTILFGKAQGVYTYLKAQGKGKRNYDYEEAFRKFMESGSGSYGRVDAIDAEGYDELHDALFPYDQKHVAGKNRKPKAPKKNQFKHLNLSTKGMNVGHEASIFFKGRVLLWSVSENNHSVERAHEHSVARHFFKRLSEVNWTRGSGGELVGNDEYNEESRESGGGANYVTARYGQEQKVINRAFRRF